MRIESVSPIMTRSLLAGLPKLLSGLSLSDGPPTPHAAQVATANVPMPTVQMLVVLAASDSGVERRRRMATGADKGLRLLESLHGELVAGVPSPGRLREIAAWAQAMETPEDPTLAAIMREIDVRVRVELAKFDVEV